MDIILEELFLRKEILDIQETSLENLNGSQMIKFLD